MSRGAALLCSFGVVVSVCAAPRQAAGEDAPFVPHVWLNGPAQEAVSTAVQGALRRLTLPRCAALLEELRASDGFTLSSRLARSGLGAREFLASVRFLDGGDEQRCHTDSYTVAFTRPGSRVVYICSRRFSATFPRQSIAADTSILHEFLHSLGLGENPPSPREISRMVQDRCGD